MTHKVEVSRWAIRVRCEGSASMRTACSGLDCCLTCPEGHCLRPDSKAQLAVGFGIKTLATLVVRGGRWKAFMKSMHTIPKGWETGYYYELKLFSLTITCKLWKSQWCRLHSAILKFTLMILGKRALRSHLAEKWKAFEKTFEPIA